MKRLSLKTKKFQKKKPLSPQSKLISFIFEKHEGVVKVAKKLGTSKQLVSIWRDKGKVPLGRVNAVAEKLNVPPLALNFKDLSKLLCTNISFEDVCKDCYNSLENL